MSPEEVSSVQGGIYTLGNAHMRSATPSLRSFPIVAFETVPWQCSAV